LKRFVLCLVGALSACRGEAPRPPPPAAITAEEPVDAGELLALTRSIAESERRVFSLLISKNDHLVYELYTSHLTRDHAHYVMSVTKSFTSALMGIAIGEGLVAGEEASVADALPADVFPTPEDRARFRSITIREVLGMSALDAQVPPHRSLPEDVARQKAFFASPNRLQFALSQALLPEPGVSFQYTDITPQLASGIITHASKMTALEYANARLFGPLEFRNQEWMHQDRAGIDNGAYGLRLRPIDMLKFGHLYLNEGVWNGRPIVPKEWVKTSFTPWIGPRTSTKRPIYGSYWWQFDYGPGWRGHVAVGWKGQRIAIIPEQKVVVVMTGNITDDETGYFDNIMRAYVRPAMSRGQASKEELRTLKTELEALRTSRPRFDGVEPRLIPSIAPKETHHAFRP
jgi:CubicO group peptidase (beta-lactamase class C family)